MNALVSPSVMAVKLSQSTDAELCDRDMRDMLLMLRQMEEDYKWLLFKHNESVTGANNQAHSQMSTEHHNTVKYANQKLNEDNQEMRDLCCFLDDDRQRGKKLAREWQKFGRYTATVMKREVSTYQMKLQDLEHKQDSLLKENLELKLLCISLDQELSGLTFDRDEGDGSSNVTIASETRLDDVAPTYIPTYIHTAAPCDTTDPGVDRGSTSATHQNVEGYEKRIERLEADRRNALSPHVAAEKHQPPVPRRHTPIPVYENTVTASHVPDVYRHPDNHLPYRQDTQRRGENNAPHTEAYRRAESRETRVEGHHLRGVDSGHGVTRDVNRVPPMASRAWHTNEKTAK